MKKKKIMYVRYSIIHSGQSFFIAKELISRKRKWEIERHTQPYEIWIRTFLDVTTVRVNKWLLHDRHTSYNVEFLLNK